MPRTERLGGRLRDRSLQYSRQLRDARDMHNVETSSELSRPSAFACARRAAAVESRRSSGQPAGESADKLRWAAAKASEAKDGDGYAAMRVASYLIAFLFSLVHDAVFDKHAPCKDPLWEKKERKKFSSM
ncbi:uncharacterized protein TrAtP1_010893 [Trichoderma atroviride]|uniref:uncharacterized protein n=1 Tax=Hypocrea atroviridis TaxID=63577 RepID=UPI003323F991|nr:hypothetical protein TrAtP1_010893 [Trichoderma atroviride]